LALTVRRVLLSESWTGRTVYRRTRTAQLRDTTRNQRVKRVVEVSASNEEIEISGAAPLIAESSQSFPTTGQTSASISQQDL